MLCLALSKSNVVPKRPKGQKRPADLIGTAIMFAKLATSEITEGQSVNRRAILTPVEG